VTQGKRAKWETEIFGFQKPGCQDKNRAYQLRKRGVRRLQGDKKNKRRASQSLLGGSRGKGGGARLCSYVERVVNEKETQVERKRSLSNQVKEYGSSAEGKRPRKNRAQKASMDCLTRPEMVV